MRGGIWVAGAAVAMVAAGCAARELSSTIRGRVTDIDGVPLEDVKVSATLSGGIHRNTKTNEAGDYEIRNLPPGSFSVGAEINESHAQGLTASPLRAGQTFTADFQFPRGCLRPPTRPEAVVVDFHRMLTEIDAVAYGRVVEVDPIHPEITDTACVWVRPYGFDLVTLVEVTPRRGYTPIFWFGRSQDRPLRQGDELITFLSRDRDGIYHEYSAAYRIPVRNGRIDGLRSTTPIGVNGTTIAEALKAITALVAPRGISIQVD